MQNKIKTIAHYLFKPFTFKKMAKQPLFMAVEAINKPDNVSYEEWLTYTEEQRYANLQLVSTRFLVKGTCEIVSYSENGGGVIVEFNSGRLFHIATTIKRFDAHMQNLYNAQIVFENKMSTKSLIKKNATNYK